MTEELRLWAVNADSFRECFAAPPELRLRLEQIAQVVVSDANRKPSTSLLSKLGPLLRAPAEGAVIRPGIPNRQDAEAMMTSRYISTERLSACWVLARAWLDELALTSTTIPLSSDLIDHHEFDLARTEVPTGLSIRHLWRNSLDIPLRTTDSMSIGYMPYPKVVSLHAAWTKAVDEFEESTSLFTRPLLDFVAGFPTLAQEAQTRDLRPPDLLAWWTGR